MKRNNKVILLIVALLSIISFSFFRCENDPYDQKTYFDVIGRGYVFYYGDSTNNPIPLPECGITVTTTLVGGGVWFGTPPVKEEYLSDANGCFHVRFIKHTHKKDAIGYFFSIFPTCPSGYDCIGTILGDRISSLSVEDIQMADKIIDLDTTKVLSITYTPN
jgi:hypothetical protein